MGFRKCDICGELTEIKVESVKTCSSCNMKFDMPFEEWKIKNPTRTFEDYKLEFCLSDKKVNFFNKKKKVYYWIGAIILIISLPLLKYQQRQDIKDVIGNFKTMKEITDLKWNKQTIGLTGITIETPYTFIKKDDSLMQKKSEKIDNNEIYKYENKDFQILIQCMDYKLDTVEKKLKTYMENFCNSIENQEDFSDYKSTVDSLFIGKIKGYSVTGSYKTMNIDYSFSSVLFGKDKRIWCIMSFYKTENILANESTTRLIKSIEIKYK